MASFFFNVFYYHPPPPPSPFWRQWGVGKNRAFSDVSRWNLGVLYPTLEDESRKNGILFESSSSSSSSSIFFNF